MIMATRPFGSLCRLALALSGLTLGLHGLRAGSNLLDNSPFLPVTAAAAAAAKDTAPLELRSIIKVGESYEFSLYDPAKKQSTWAKLNEAGNDFVIKAYDANNQAVTVEQRARSYRLVLKEAKIAAMAAGSAQSGTTGNVSPGGPFPGAAGAIGPGGAPPPGSRGPSGNAPALTPDQIKNLEADINRRRELRRQAATGAPQSPQQQR